MALFNTKKEDKKKEDVSKKTIGDLPSLSIFLDKEPADIIIKPRITEKATDSQQNNVYVFEVTPNANKRLIEGAFQKIYKVKPKKINITKNPSKSVFVRGKKGFKNGVKKAYVYLNEGDKIEIV